MLKRILTLVLALILIFCVAGCDIKSGADLPEYSKKEFEIAGFVSPREVSEESFQTYKDAGFNLVAFGSVEEEWSSDIQYYLGSNITKKALDICKKLGLKADLQFGAGWVVDDIEGEGYYSEKPFSQLDIYGDYKDIITGIHIYDEPNKDAIDTCANKTFIEDFKNTYPNASYVINITPKYAGSTPYGFVTYDQLVEYYSENIMSQFEKPYISVDYYPFPSEESGGYARRQDLLITYNTIANAAKKYNAKKRMILQASTGAEFAESLTEADMRFQVNMALAFGADQLQYYCYTVPLYYDYNYCVMTREDTPSDVYYWLKDIHKEIQSYADVILSYDWADVTAVIANNFSANYDINSIRMKDLVAFEDSEHYITAASTADLVISRFESDEYGEAFMLVNYSEDRENTNTATVTLKNCKKVAIYGGNNYNGTPKIVKLDDQGQFAVDLAYGEGVFVAPII